MKQLMTSLFLFAAMSGDANAHFIWEVASAPQDNDTVARVNSGADKRPTEIAPLPTAVSSLGAAIVDDWLYVYGGHTGQTHVYSTATVVGTFHRLRLSEPGDWQSLPPGPPMQGLGFVAHLNKIYRIGGMQPRNQPGEPADNHSLSTCAVFDTAGKRWSPLPDLPQARSSHEVVVCGGKLIVVGGWQMSGAGATSRWHNSALILDLKSEPLRWQVVKQPFERRALAAVTYNDHVYVIGGMTKDAGVAPTVNIYNPVNNTWTTGPDIPGGKRNGFSPAACVADGRLYLSTTDGNLSRLAANGASWEPAGELKQGRVVHRMAANRDRLVVVGGASDGKNLARIELLDLPPRTTERNQQLNNERR